MLLIYNLRTTCVKRKYRQNIDINGSEKVVIYEV